MRIVMSAMKLQQTENGVILDVYVKPNSKIFRLELDENELVAFCCEAPIKSRVNRELLKKFSRLFNRKIELVSGGTSRQKRFLISNIKGEEVKQILSYAINC